MSFRKIYQLHDSFTVALFLKVMNGMHHLVILQMQIHGVLIVLGDMLVVLIKPSKLHLAEMVSLYLIF